MPQGSLPRSTPRRFPCPFCPRRSAPSRVPAICRYRYSRHRCERASGQSVRSSRPFATGFWTRPVRAGVSGRGRLHRWWDAGCSSARPAWSTGHARGRANLPRAPANSRDRLRWGPRVRLVATVHNPARWPRPHAAFLPIHVPASGPPDGFPVRPHHIAVVPAQPHSAPVRAVGPTVAQAGGFLLRSRPGPQRQWRSCPASGPRAGCVQYAHPPAMHVFPGIKALRRDRGQRDMYRRDSSPRDRYSAGSSGDRTDRRRRCPAAVRHPCAAHRNARLRSGWCCFPIASGSPWTPPSRCNQDEPLANRPPSLRWGPWLSADDKRPGEDARHGAVADHKHRPQHSRDYGECWAPEGCWPLARRLRAALDHAEGA